MKLKEIINKFIKYAVWWGIAAIVDLSILYILTSIFWIYYLISATISFIVSFFVWFFFQKYITFENYDKKHMSQGFLFLVFQVIWMWINLLLLYIWVSILWFYYLYVAIFNKIIIFIWNFSMNYFFNFKQK